MLQEVFELEGDRAWTAASGFGGGIGRTQLVCGALSGGVIALGLLAGQSVDDPKVNPKQVGDAVRPRARALVESFHEAFGATDCGDLVPFDFRAPGGHDAFKASGIKTQTCCRFVSFVVEQLVKDYREAAGSRPEPLSTVELTRRPTNGHAES